MAKASPKGNRGQVEIGAIETDLAASGAFDEAAVPVVTEEELAAVMAQDAPKQQRAKFDAEFEAATAALGDVVAVPATPTESTLELEILAGTDPRLAGRLGVDTKLIEAGTHIPSGSTMSGGDSESFAPHRRPARGSQRGSDQGDSRKTPADRMAAETRDKLIVNTVERNAFDF